MSGYSGKSVCEGLYFGRKENKKENNSIKITVVSEQRKQITDIN